MVCSRRGCGFPLSLCSVRHADAAKEITAVRVELEDDLERVKAHLAREIELRARQREEYATCLKQVGT